MKYTTSKSTATYPAVQKPETQPNVISDIEGGQKTDPSVRLGPLRGEPLGAVPMSVTMGKPQAYKAKRGPP